jgi:palmitoyltransferase
VGLRNHKSFFLFLFYTCVLCVYGAQDTARVLLVWVSNEDNVSPPVPCGRARCALTPKLHQGFETSPIAWAILLFVAFIVRASEERCYRHLADS